jgi:hypothetical protein
VVALRYRFSTSSASPTSAVKFLISLTPGCLKGDSDITYLYADWGFGRRRLICGERLLVSPRRSDGGGEDGDLPCGGDLGSSDIPKRAASRELRLEAEELRDRGAEPRDSERRSRDLERLGDLG